MTRYLTQCVVFAVGCTSSGPIADGSTSGESWAQEADEVRPEEGGGRAVVRAAYSDPPILTGYAEAQATAGGTSPPTSGAGSGADVQGSPEVVANITPDSAWEEFRAAAERTLADGVVVYIVDNEFWFADESALREYFESMNASSEKTVVATLNGVDLTLEDGKQLHIRYCVSNSIWPGGNAGPPQTRAQVVATIAAAARAWEAQANVRFELDDSLVAGCIPGAPTVDFAVVVGCFGTGADAGCARRTDHPVFLGCCVDGAANNPVRDGVVTLNFNSINSLNVINGTTGTGVALHELGHYLGLRHENSFGGTCEAQTTDYGVLGVFGGRLVTDATDPQSVMWDCNRTADYALSVQDGVGIRRLYGMPVSWYVATGVI